MIIAVDFDGTLCFDQYPNIGEPRQFVIDFIKDQQKKGAKIILNTCRSGKYELEAVVWCMELGIRFDAVNKNLPEQIAKYNGDCRKIFADIYLDDKAVYPSRSEIDRLERLMKELSCEDKDHDE